MSDLNKQIDELNKRAAELQENITAATLREAYPRLSPKTMALLSTLSLRAEAAKGRLTVKQVDEALTGKGLSPAASIATKLELQWAGILR